MWWSFVARSESELTEALRVAGSTPVVPYWVAPDSVARTPHRPTDRGPSRPSIVRGETDRIAIGEVLKVDEGALRLLVDGELHLSVGLVGGTNVEQLE